MYLHAIMDIEYEVDSFSRFHYLELSVNHSSHELTTADWQLYYADKGALLMNVQDCELVLESGKAILVPPGEDLRLSVCNNQAANLYVIWFALGRGRLEPYSNSVFAITPELRAHIKLILKEAKYAYSNDLRDLSYTGLQPSVDRPFGVEQMMKLLLEQFLINMVRESMSVKSKGFKEIVRENLIVANLDANPFFDQLIQYLDNNISQQLTLDKICRDNFTNRSKVQKVFRECTTEGIISFHQKLKIEYAKLMIRESKHNFTQIAAALGFSSVHHFSKKFKQLVGMSPSVYARFSK